MKIRKPTFIRLTPIEYKHVKSLNPGDRFVHINLLHEDTVLQKYPDSIAIEIKKHGSESYSHRQDPKLNLNKTIKLKMLELIPNISIQKLSKILFSYPMILHNPNGIIESLYDRYGKVRGLTNEKILNSTCYARIFEKL